MTSPAMRIELITTGSELLLGFTLNTHVNYLARALAPLGLRLHRHVTTADNRADMRAAIADALTRADILLITGGLGPTSDDVTRDVIAELLDRPLHRDDAVVAAMRDRARRRGYAVPESSLVQALVPAGAQVLPNPNGTAPGLALDHDGRLLLLLPGPPRELQPMFAESVVPLLRVRCAGLIPADCRTLRVAGLGESQVAERIAPVLRRFSDLEVGYCARPGEVEVRVIHTDAARTAAAERDIRAALGTHVFGTGDERLEEVVIRQLSAAGQTLAVAESCTGGLIAHRLTNVPGASAVLLAGWIPYSNAAKIRDLGVAADTLRQCGAVSEETARAMAAGARARAGADLAVVTTGIAGPTGGTPEKPVGLVYLALATARGPTVERHLLRFERETFKQCASQFALDLIRRLATE